MADTGIFATTAEVQRKVPYGASATANTEAYINQYMTEAESYINSATRTNWSDVYSTLNVDTKGILKMVASSFAAICVINYDMRGFSGLSYAQSYMNVLWNSVQEGIKVLLEGYNREFIEEA